MQLDEGSEVGSGLNKTINILLTVAVVATLALVISHDTRQVAPNFKAYEVMGVIDGDTLDLNYNGRSMRVRLHGIDCPEHGQDFGAKAKWVASELVFGKRVEFRELLTDQYGRAVGIVVRGDGLNLNHEMVRRGMCWWYRKFAPNDKILQELERDARDRKVGLWSSNRPLPPWKYRWLKRNSDKW